MQHTDGRWIWILSRGMVVERDAAGTVVRIVGTHLDITERKRTDAELLSATEMLRASEEQLRQVTDNMPALVSCIDVEQRFRFVNRTYMDWLDIEPSSLYGVIHDLTARHEADLQRVRSEERLSLALEGSGLA